MELLQLEERELLRIVYLDGCMERVRGYGCVVPACEPAQSFSSLSHATSYTTFSLRISDTYQGRPETSKYIDIIIVANDKSR